MFWILLMLVGILLMLVGMKRDWDAAGPAWFFLIGLGLMITLVLAGKGISYYPELKAQQEKVFALQSEIGRITDARYSSIKSGSLVGGSLDNMNQSTALSLYIAEYARTKAEYNKDLTYAQTIKKITMYKWFGYSLFMCDEIDKLPLL